MDKKNVQISKMEIINSISYDGPKSTKWISDHKMVITDVEI